MDDRGVVVVVGCGRRKKEEARRKKCKKGAEKKIGRHLGKGQRDSARFIRLLNSIKCFVAPCDGR